MAKVDTSSCVEALHWSASHLEGLSSLLTLHRRAETSDCTQVFVGFPTGSCGSCDTGQRVLHGALHRALVLVTLALIPLALLPNLFLSIVLHKHIQYGISTGSRESKGQMSSRQGQGILLTLCL